MLRIALLYGGTSSEREVSLKSGAAAGRALEEIGHHVTPHCLDRDSLVGVDLKDSNFVFIALHGGWGENGGVQALLRRAGIPFSGSGPIACRLAMDKALTKSQFLTHRVPTPDSMVLPRDGATARLKSMGRRVGFPLIVKPVAGGSSIGVSLVQTPEQGQAALDEAFAHGERALVERFIPGRELTVGIIGARAYPVVEVATTHDFFDYEAKYRDAQTRYGQAADLTPVQERMAQHYAKRAHHALRCEGYSRVDMRLAPDGSISVLEVNTHPGLTERSLLPMATKLAGMTYEETVQAMIDASLCGIQGRSRSGVYGTAAA